MRITSILLFILSTSATLVVGGGLQATYYDNINLEEPSIFQEVEESINFNLRPGDIKHPQMTASSFSVTYEGALLIDRSGLYSLNIIFDDAVRVFFDDELLIDEWDLTGLHSFTTEPMPLDADSTHKLRIDYRQIDGPGKLQLKWSSNLFPQRKIDSKHFVEPSTLSEEPTLVLEKLSLVESQAFRATLSLPPVEPVLVSLNNLVPKLVTFSNCSLLLDETNWNKGVDVLLIPSRTATIPNGVVPVVEAHAEAIAAPVSLQMELQDSVRSCSGWGAGHLIRLDRQMTQVSTAGTYNMIVDESHGFSAHAAFIPCGNASCVSSISLKYLSTVMNFSSDGNQHIVKQLESSDNQFNIRSVGDSFYQVDTPFLSVEILFRPNHQLDHDIIQYSFIGAFSASSYGLCAGSDLSSSSASQQVFSVDIRDFVPQSCSDNQEAIVYPLMFHASPAEIVSQVSLEGSPHYQSIEKPATYVSQATITPNNGSICFDLFRSEDANICATKLQVPAAKYLSACLDDAPLSSIFDNSFAYSAFDSMVSSCILAAKKQAFELPSQFSCPSLCNLNGVCGADSICKCADGFEGFMCESATSLPSDYMVSFMATDSRISPRSRQTQETEEKTVEEPTQEANKSTEPEETLTKQTTVHREVGWHLTLKDRGFIPDSSEAGGMTTFNYILNHTEDPNTDDLGYWMLEIPNCAQISVIHTRPSTMISPLYSDTTTGITGFKWNLPRNVEKPLEFMIVLSGHVEQGSTRFGLVSRNGQVDSAGAVAGPECTLMSNLVCDARGPYQATCIDSSAAIQLGAVQSSAIDSYSWTAPAMDNLRMTNSQTSSPALIISDPSCDTSFDLTLTVIGDDEEEQCTASVRVTDDQAPEFLGLHAPDMRVECDDLPAAPIVVARDNCAMDVQVYYNERQQDDDSDGLYQLRRTWSAVDTCRNEKTHTQVITVVDTQAPQLFGIDENIEVECHSIPQPCHVYAQDTCSDNVEIKYTEKIRPGICEHSYTLIRTWTAIDEAGNEASGEQFVDVIDSEPPALIGAPSEDITVECHLVPLPLQLSALDACDADVQVKMHEDRQDTPNSADYSLTRTYSATDTCGNSASASHTITVVDTTAPILIGIPGDVETEPNHIPEVCNVEARDNCAEDPKITFTEQIIPGHCEHQYTIIRTWTVVDGSGNTYSQSQQISVSDVTPPTLHGVPHSDQSFSCDDVAVPPVTATDNASENIQVEVDEQLSEVDGVKTITRTFSAVDECGNSASKSYTITISDIEPPTLVGVPKDTKSPCDSIPPPPMIQAIDNCQAGCDSLDSVEFSEVREDGACSGEFTLTRTWSAIDCSGNTVSHSQIMHIEDNQAPVLHHLPGDLIVECDQVPESADVVGVDNCDARVNVEFSEEIQDTVSDNDYTIVRTWTATDSCGSTTSSSQTIIVEDTSSPELLHVPRDSYMECGDGIQEQEPVQVIDACDANIELETDTHTIDETCPGSYTLVNTWSATDQSGNFVEASQLVTIVDTTAPQFENLPPAQMSAEAGHVPEPAKLTVVDSCDQNLSLDADAITFTEESDADDRCGPYHITRTWSASDHCGNTVDFTQRIAVLDTTEPQLEDLPDEIEISVTCDDIPQVPQVSAVDDADDAVVVEFTEKISSWTCDNSYTMTRTWKAIDCSGNQAIFRQTIHVADTIAPVFVIVPEAELHIPCDQISAQVIPVVEAEDNCSDEVAIEYQEIRTPTERIGEDYTIIRTWQAFDSCGNSEIFTQTVHVTDTVPPELIGVPEENTPDNSVSLPCDDIPSIDIYRVTARDNCAVFDPEDDTSVTVEEIRLSGDCGNQYTLQRTWTAVDAAGNSASKSHIIRAVDTQAPVLSGLPAPTLTKECGQDDEPVYVVANDKCQGEVDVNFSETIETEDLEDSEAKFITRRWVATDDCGNNASFTQTITVKDNTAPAFNGPSITHIDASCGEIVDVPDVTANDACYGLVSVDFSEHVQVSTPRPGQNTTTRTWTTTDIHGNVASTSQTVTFTDEAAPQFINLPLSILEVERCDIPSPEYPLAIDACEGNIDIELSESSTSAIDISKPHGDYMFTRTFTATDSGSNSESYVQTVYVRDHTKPEFPEIATPAVMHECDNIPEVVDVPATDCNIDHTIVSMTESTHSYSCPSTYTLTRTYTAVDGSGNIATLDLDYSIHDSTPPSLVDSEGEIYSSKETTLQVECGEEPEPPIVGAIDSCDETVSANLVETITNHDNGKKTHERKWTARDACGNTASMTHTLLISDTMPPTLHSVPEDVHTQHEFVSRQVPQVIASDTCDGYVDVHFETEISPGDCEHSYTIIRRWTATDTAGNTATETQYVHVLDNTAPVLSSKPEDITVEEDAVPEAPVITAVDSSDPEPHVIYTEERIEQVNGLNKKHIYTLLRKWCAVDACDNQECHTQTITVEDNTPPELIGVPPDAEYECDELPLAEITTAIIAHATEDESVVTLEEEVLERGCQGFIKLNRTWTAIDGFGNSASGTQIITLVDTTVPELSNLPSHLVSLELCEDEPVAAPVTATDNCAVEDDETHDHSVGPTDVTLVEERRAGVGGAYVLIRTWIATDDCGHSTSFSQRIEFEDTTAPVFVSLVEGDELPQATVHASCDEIPAVPSIAATDCSVDGFLKVQYAQVTLDWDCESSYTIQRTWSVSDESGNMKNMQSRIKVVDTEKPTFTDNEGFPLTYLEDVYTECGTPAPMPIIKAIDQCDQTPTVEYTQERQEDTIIRTWTALDSCGNYNTLSQNIMIQDTTAPVLIGIPADVTVACDLPMIAPLVTAVDACNSGDIKVELNEVYKAGACDGDSQLIRTWTAVDKAGNQATATQTITLTDSIAPVLVNVPNDIQVECGDEPSAPTITATDSCMEAQVEVSLNEEIIQSYIPGIKHVMHRTWTATDSCGNSVSKTQTIQVTDSEEPVITLEESSEEAAALWLNADSIRTECDNIPVHATGTATDNCDSDVPVVYSQEVHEYDGQCKFLTIRTWTSTDSAGHSTSRVRSILAVDSTPPVFVGHEDIEEYQTVECHQVPPPPHITAHDNCEGEIEVHQESHRLPLSCPSAEAQQTVALDEREYNYRLARTWTATDSCGNTAVFSTTILVVDTTAPVFHGLPRNLEMEVNCDATLDVPTRVTASDNCDQDIQVVITEHTTDFRCQFEYTLVRVFSATDLSGNVARIEQLIHVRVQNPPFLKPLPKPHLEASCDAVPAQPVVTASHECGDILMHFSEVRKDECELPIGGFGEPNDYTLTRTWTASICGLSASATQVVVVRDQQAPQLHNVPDDISHECDMVVDYAHVTVTDNCDLGVVVVPSEETTQGECSDSHTITRKWEATDSCGNSVEAVQTVNVVDTTAPSFSSIPISHVTVSCDAIPEPAKLTAQDNCDQSVHAAELTTIRHDGGNGCDYSLVNTWTAADQCGNIATLEQITQVEDKIAPVLTGVPSDERVEINQVVNISEVYVVAEDACDPDVEVVTNEQKTEGVCSGSYYLKRQWTATDNCGNTAESTQIVTVVDSTPPQITLSTEALVLTVECKNVPEIPESTVTDNSGEQDITIEFTEREDYNEDESDPQLIHTLTRTWIAVDSCGNEAQVVQIIRVYDTTPPVLSAPYSENEELPADAQVGPDQIPVTFEGEVVATDDCDCDPIDVTMNEEIIPGDCQFTFTIKRTWSASDKSGNSVSHTQTLEVFDLEAPQLVGGPSSDQLEISTSHQEIPFYDVTATDNSIDGLLPVEYIETKSQEESACTYILTRVWSAVDACGNSVSLTQIVTVVDSVAPKLNDYPEDETIQCDETSSPCKLHAIDDCSEEIAQVVFTEEKILSTNPTQGVLYELHRTWTAVDGSGNKIEHSQVVTVVDTVAPVLSRTPQDTEADCGCDAFPAVQTVRAVDNCDDDIEVHFTETRTALPDSDEEYTADLDNFYIIRVWTATDSAGNSVSHTQTITVSDGEKPTLSLAPTSDLISIETVAHIPVVTASDNCDTNIHVEFEEAKQPGTCPHEFELTRTWSATDRSGHTTSHTQHLNVVDIQPPSASPESEEQTCLWPANDQFIAIQDAKSSIFNPTDNSEGNIKVDFISCNSTQTIPTRSFSRSQAFSSHCTYDSIHDVLYVKASTDANDRAGRKYVLHASLTDECGNSMPVRKTFWVPHQAVDWARQGITCQEATLSTSNLEAN